MLLSQEVPLGRKLLLCNGNKHEFSEHRNVTQTGKSANASALRIYLENNALSYCNTEIKKEIAFYC